MYCLLLHDKLNQTHLLPMNSGESSHKDNLEATISSEEIP